MEEHGLPSRLKEEIEAARNAIRSGYLRLWKTTEQPATESKDPNPSGAASRGPRQHPPPPDEDAH